MRSFEPGPLDEAALTRILEAGRRAPSSRNWQPWDFVLVTDREQLAELATVWQGAGHVPRSTEVRELVGRSAAALDPDLARRLWQASGELAGVGFPLA